MDMIFRFWDRIQNRWTVITSGQAIKRQDYNHLFVTFNTNDNLVESIIPTQSIGEKDKNGKKIFVGDWVHNKHDELFLIQHDGICIYAERWIPDYRCMGDCCTNRKTSCWTSEVITPLYSVLIECEVVGNQFENPDLYKTFYQEKEGEVNVKEN